MANIIEIISMECVRISFPTAVPIYHMRNMNETAGIGVSAAAKTAPHPLFKNVSMTKNKQLTSMVISDRLSGI